MTLENSIDAQTAPRRANLPLFIGARCLSVLSGQMQSVAVGWHVYSTTGSALSLGLVGLAQFLPLVTLFAWTGRAADVFDRRTIASFSVLGQALCSAALFALALFAAPIWLIYPVLFCMGSARAFSAPAMSSLLPDIVERPKFSRAVALSTSVMQLATIAGPAAGGLVYAVTGAWQFLVCAALFGLCAPLVMAIGRPPPKDDSARADRGALAGLRYIKSNRMVLGAVSLDLFAVLFGGVSALLPIFAQDILHVGPAGLGLLRAGPAVGAALIGFFLTVLPMRRGIGPKMFLCVGGYGVATIVFALSHSFWLSLAAMASLGAFDVVSMVVRQTLVQISTPADMRGRVSAVSFLAIGASNELGEFESGVAAAALGAVGSALLGGVATLAIVGLWAWAFPQLRQADSMEG